MGGKFGSGHAGRQMSKMSNRSPKLPGTIRQSVDVVDRSQGKRKVVH